MLQSRGFEESGIANLCYGIGNGDGFNTWAVRKQATGHDGCAVLNSNVFQPITVIKSAGLIIIDIFRYICRA